MKEYLEKRSRMENVSVWIGVMLTLVLHAGSLVLVSFTGIKYIYPPPEETSMLIDFEEAPEWPEQQIFAEQPKGEDVNLEEAVSLVQRSESPVETPVQENLTPETAPDPVGDVEVPTPEPPKEPVLDPRAAFPGMAKKDTTLTAAHSATEGSPEWKAGQPKGNTSNGRTDGKPNAHLKGRKVVDGNIPLPKYNEQDQGIVVVTIWVDQYGTVQRAQPGADGTTVTNSKLWAAARAAAMETHFNMSADAPALQEGTITYIFNLK